MKQTSLHEKVKEVFGKASVRIKRNGDFMEVCPDTPVLAPHHLLAMEELGYELYGCVTEYIVIFKKGTAEREGGNDETKNQKD